MCYGGTSTTADVCYAQIPDITSLTVTDNNNIIVNFNKPVFFNATLTIDDFEIVITKTTGA